MHISHPTDITCSLDLHISHPPCTHHILQTSVTLLVLPQITPSSHITCSLFTSHHHGSSNHTLNTQGTHLPLLLMSHTPHHHILPTLLFHTSIEQTCTRNTSHNPHDITSPIPSNVTHTSPPYYVSPLLNTHVVVFVPHSS